MSKKLQQQVDEAMSSLDELRRAEASPYLYSKVRNRLQAQKQSMPQSLAWRMVAALVIVALLNLFTLRHAAKQPAKDGVQSIALEYSIVLPQTY